MLRFWPSFFSFRELPPGFLLSIFAVFGRWLSARASSGDASRPRR
jgi:hypothetical protein